MDQGLELQPLVSINTDSSFYDIAWGPLTKITPEWTRQGAAVQPLKPNILATAGAKGEIFVFDVNDPSTPFRLGTAAARADDIECLAWNRKVSHILATGGAGGFVTVWDLKTKKPSLTLNNNRKAVSAIAWDPNNSTKLLTSTPDDSTPVIFLWDLRNSNAPERVLQGHEQGVLSLSWCQQDSTILLSCGKDNKAIVWNPQTGERYGEFPEVTNWTFSTRFNPHNPNLVATASFDGKITIQTLQNTNPSTSQAAAQNSLDGEDFFTSAQTQPQDNFFSLPKAPKWAERPIGASFGFGGKLFSADSEVSDASAKFEETLNSGDLTTIFESRIDEAGTDSEKADWKAMQTLATENARQKIVEQLGFKSEEVTNGVSTKSAEKTDEGAPDAEGETEGDDDFFSKGAADNGPFQILGDEDSEVDQEITKAVMLGNFAKAADLCLKEDRMADAFLIANCGGQDLVDKVQTAYIASKKGAPSYVRLLGSVITKDLWDVVNNADLSNWKEAMAVLCTFSSPDDFPNLCEALGDRIVGQGAREDASFCYLVGSKLDKVVPIWVSVLEEAEKAGLGESKGGSSFSVHAKTLQDFIEKVTVFRHVSKFQDKDTGATSEWKLAALYDKYIEYADIVAAHGQLTTAQKYLDLLPAEYPAAEIARNRVRLATKKAAPQPAAKQATSRAPSRVQPAFGYQPPQPMQPANPVAPDCCCQSLCSPSATTPYAPQAAASPYAPRTWRLRMPRLLRPDINLRPRSQPLAHPLVTDRLPPILGLPAEHHSFETPATPKQGVAPVTAPFGAQAGLPGPPQAGGSFSRTGATPPPPPPKASGPPRVTSPLAAAVPFGQQPPRPPSTAANTYAPPPPQAGALPTPNQPIVPRVSSPYSVSPAGPPPSNKYAPAPAPSPPKNPYAPAGFSAPPEQQTRPPVGPPPSSRPPVGPPPSSGPPHAARPPPAAQTPPPAAAPPRARHPPGDRSHIPANAQRLVDILTRDMQRVAARAPANFAPQVKDTQKRLGLLFDHLNNDELVKQDTIEQLSELAGAIESRSYDAASSIQVNIQTTKTEECGNWMVGIKRLIMMSKNTPE
ncbi:unnamed protein product [Parascedosporium putredinis]|uniref:Protein transport protein SEC31 n=1 Tax=Parascedosporium putredinis TaxID=1442378 RepID=A0A9P1GXC8_9PEZI|nr:unnamed protein product [Parascedosporium putredinis]CAI7990464.1 unnamed protein product [Parascedosporium putredinis]